MSELRQEFIEFAVSAGVIRFGEFMTKSKRLSPYFFNAGLFNQGQTLARLAQYYAQTLEASGVAYDMLFGPAYKGITLAAATAMALAAHGRNVPFAYNRKEAKDHGEGGNIIGAKLSGKVVIIDDVITAGTSVRESVEMIRQAGAEPCAVLIALDRMERSGSEGALSDLSSVQQVSKEFGIPVISIANLNDLFDTISKAGASPELAQYKAAISSYRSRYGALG